MDKGRIWARRLQLTGFALVIAVFSGATNCRKTTPPVEFTILHTNDIHSRLRALPTTAMKNPFGLGGLAKLKTLVDQIRSQRPNTLLLDAGDWSESAAYFSVDAGSNSLKILDEIGYNATVVGNHDFLNGPSEVAATIERAKPHFPVLAANKDLTSVLDASRVEPLLPEYTILEVGSGSDKIRVGLIGLLTEEYLYYDYFKLGVITNPVDKATEIANRLHGQKLADVIVLLSHNSFDKNLVFAKQIPWINVVLSGHSHAKTPVPVTITNAGQPVYVAEAGHSGMFLGEMTLKVNRDTRQVELANYVLHPVTPGLADNAQIAAAVARQDRGLIARTGEDVFETIVGNAEVEMPHNDTAESLLANMAADAYRAASGADIGMESSNLIDQGIAAGRITAFDAYNVSPHAFHPIAGYPFPEFGRTWTVKTMAFKGSELRFLLDTVLLAGKAQAIWISTSGLRITYSNNLGVSPIRTMEVFDPIRGDYHPLNDQGTYRVALHDGLLLAIKIIVNKTGLPLNLLSLVDTGIETWQAIRELIAKHQTLRVEDFDLGVRYKTIEGDIGLYPHMVDVTQDDLGNASVAITVRNEGLTELARSSLGVRAARGEKNDMVNADTDAENIALGTDAVVPPLRPGETARLTFAWQRPAAGIYGVRFLVLGNDGNPTNNKIVTHVTIH